MPKIEITYRCHTALRTAALRTFRDTGLRLPNGNIEIRVDDEVLLAITMMQVDGETLSDTIERLVFTSKNGLS